MRETSLHAPPKKNPKSQRIIIIDNKIVLQLIQVKQNDQVKNLQKIIVILYIINKT